MIKENHRDIENEGSGRRGLSQDDVGNEMMLRGPNEGFEIVRKGELPYRHPTETSWMVRDKRN